MKAMIESILKGFSKKIKRIKYMTINKVHDESMLNIQLHEDMIMAYLLIELKSIILE